MKHGRLYMRAFLFWFAGGLFLAVRAQTLQISGNVTDPGGKPLEKVLVMVKQNSKIISYGYTDSLGHFALAKLPDTFMLQLRKLQYKSVDTLITGGRTHFRFIMIPLEESIEQLNEIQINISEIPSRRVADTVRYQVEKYIDSTETNLKEMLNKLPGVRVRGNDIYVRGEKVTYLLFNGRNTFGNNKKIPLEQLPPDMVKSVEYYENYKDKFDLTPQGFLTGKSALNILLKEEAMKIWRGNLEAGAGYAQKAGGQMSVYRFGASGDVFAMLNGNNMGKEVANINDFLQWSPAFMSFSEAMADNGMAWRRNDFFGFANRFSDFETKRVTSRLRIQAAGYRSVRQAYSEERRIYFADDLSGDYLRKNSNQKQFSGMTAIHYLWKNPGKGVWKLDFSSISTGQNEKNRFQANENDHLATARQSGNNVMLEIGHSRTAGHGIREVKFGWSLSQFQKDLQWDKQHDNSGVSSFHYVSGEVRNRLNLQLHYKGRLHRNWFYYVTNKTELMQERLGILFSTFERLKRQLFFNRLRQKVIFIRSHWIIQAGLDHYWIYSRRPFHRKRTNVFFPEFKISYRKALWYISFSAKTGLYWFPFHYFYDTRWYVISPYEWLKGNANIKDYSISSTKSLHISFEPKQHWLEEAGLNLQYGKTNDPVKIKYFHDNGYLFGTYAIGKNDYWLDTKFQAVFRRKKNKLKYVFQFSHEKRSHFDTDGKIVYHTGYGFTHQLITDLNLTQNWLLRLDLKENTGIWQTPTQPMYLRIFSPSFSVKWRQRLFGGYFKIRYVYNSFDSVEQSVWTTSLEIYRQFKKAGMIFLEAQNFNRLNEEKILSKSVFDTYIRIQSRYRFPGYVVLGYKWRF